MSRVGKKPIQLPESVTATVSDGSIFVKGPKGELSRELHRDIQASIEERTLVVSPRRQSKDAPALWGLSRALIANMVQGVTEGFQKKLELEGVGYRANMDGKDLVMQLGFSHPVRFSAPEAITLATEKNTITISGIDKEQVGQMAATIRAMKKPEPYKGKGIRYQGEIIRRKAGKRAGAA